ncbi:MAG: response regulator, partial [Oscillospiraceae bacterium]
MSETYDVVIAEDETVQLRSLSAMVTASDLPFRVVGMAQDGDEAIAFIKQLKPQLVIVDIQMPRCSGLEVLKYIAEHKLGITSIVISGFTAFEYAQEALRYGAGEYLLKPVTRAQLFNTLQVFLTRFRDNGRTGERFSLHRMLSGAPTELPGACSHFFLMLVSIGNYPYSVAAPEMAEINLSRMAMQSAERLLQVDEQFFMTRGPAVGQIYCLFGIQC